jgi:predicted amidophosphoribosyltransferase
LASAVTVIARGVDTNTNEKHCGACGEENPRDFSICWQCQRPL